MCDISVTIRLWHNSKQEMKWRINYFYSVVLPRLKMQTQPNFDICILTHPDYFEELRSLDDRIKPFTLSAEIVGENYDKWHYRTHGNFQYKDTIGLDRYHVQVRMDSDDLVEPNFIETIEKNIDRSQRSIVTFQPQLFILSDLKIREMNHKYRADRPSMFLAIHNPDLDDYKFIYEEVFFRFGRYPGKCFSEGTCFMTIHNSNVGSGVHS